MNKFYEAWLTAGQKVTDLQAKQQEIALKAVNDPDSVSDEELVQIKDQLAKALKVRDFAKKAYDDYVETSETTSIEDKIVKSPATVEQKKAEDITKQFINDFKDVVTSAQEGKGGAGLTIPSDIQYQIRELRRTFVSLENLVNVENVNNPSGTRVYEKSADITPLSKIDQEDGSIQSIDEPELTTIKYLVKRYAGLMTVTNTLLKDTAENILAWLNNWIVKKDVVTRNTEILATLKKGTKTAQLAKFDDIKDLVLATLDPAIAATSSFVTNRTGFSILAKVKDAQGRYLMQPSVTNPEIYQIEGKTVTVIDDKFLPDDTGKHPLYFGDFKEAITLFDRQNMTIDATNIGAGSFETDTVKIRVIDRFDTQLIDPDAFVSAPFTAVTDQVAASTASSPK